MEITTKEIQKVMRQLKTHKIRVQDVPEELAYNMRIIKAERRYGLRASGNRGFDVIEQKFFVEENSVKESRGQPINGALKQAIIR